MDLVQCEGVLAAAPAAGVIVSATRPVQVLGKQRCCGSVNIFLPDPYPQSRNPDLRIRIQKTN